jgi:3-polyprenyl-4-hydroxybenzoate decarboxylase
LVHDLRETAVKDVYITQSSGSWGHIIVSMRPVFPGHAKNIGELCSALLHATAGKIVTVVNDDIDVRDPFMVDWAVTFRCDPARDVTLLPNCTAPELDPSVGNVAGVVPTEKRILGSKMIIDATIKSEYPPCSAPSARYMYKALESWKAAGLPEFELSSSKKLFYDKHPEEEIIVKPYAFVEEEKAIPVAAVEWWQRSYDRYFHAEDGKFGLKKPIGKEGKAKKLEKRARRIRSKR